MSLRAAESLRIACDDCPLDGSQVLRDACGLKQSPEGDMETITATTWMSVFEGEDETTVDFSRSGILRKPSGSQDQGRNDEND